MDITDLKETEAALRQARDKPEERVAVRTAELAGVVRDLGRETADRQAAEEARRELLGRLVTAQEEERRRIAREMHDSLGQYLAVMSMVLKAARTAGGADELDQLVDLTREVNREVHRLGTEPRPTALDDLGLRDAVRQYVEMWSARTGVPAEFAARRLGAERSPWQLSTAVYRAVQEARTNVLKHARAARVSVILDRGPDRLGLVVEDDGAGFDPEPVLSTPRGVGGLGLPGMRERVGLVGGTVRVEATPGGGTTLFVRIPLPAPEGGRHG